MEKSFVMFKPDAVQRKKVGQIISRFENKGLTLLAMKMIHIDEPLARKHYAVHEGKPFYEFLIQFMTASPVIASVWEGKNAIDIIRHIVGATDPLEAEPGSVRGDYALNITYNLIHASDSPETADKEIQLFFKNEEILSYTPVLNEWITPQR